MSDLSDANRAIKQDEADKRDAARYRALMMKLTPEQDRIISNGKALLPELRHEISTLHYKRDFLKIHRLETIIAALSLLDELVKGAETFNFEAHLQRQREWSGKTFGPGPRTAGVVDHIRRELAEIEADPADISEWIDVVILGLDGAWRAGFQPQQIIEALVAKQTKNEGRSWPDWRTAPPDKAIEHDRSR